MTEELLLDCFNSLAMTLEELDDESQTEAATALAKKLMRRYEKEPPRAARAKLRQALARRGYGWDVVGAAVGAAGASLSM